MKRLIYLLAVMVAFSSFATAQQKVYNTMTGEMQNLEGTNKVDRVEFPQGLLNDKEAILEYINTHDKQVTVDELLPDFLMPEEEYGTYFIPYEDTQDNDTNYIYPSWPEGVDGYRTYTGLWRMPTALFDPNMQVYGVAQFVAGLEGSFDIDSMYVGMFVWDDWEDIQEDFYLIPITLTNPEFGSEDFEGLQFDFNNDDTMWEFLDDNHNLVSIPASDINNAMQADGSIKYCKIAFDPPLHIDAYQNFGFVVLPETLEPTTNRYQWFGGYEWGMDPKDVLGSVIHKFNGQDTILSCAHHIFWNFDGAEESIKSEHGQEAWDKLQPLNHAPVKTNYRFNLVGNFITSSVRQETYDAAPFSLEQNSPNPVDNETKINFSVEKQSYITLKVYNTLGEVVATLVDDYYSPGKFEATLDASNLPVGTYFYSLTAGQSTETKTLQVVR